MKAYFLTFLAVMSLFSNSCFADNLPEHKIEQGSQKIENPVTTEESASNKIGELTGNFDITSNYVFRGLSLSNNLPAFQGGLTYTFLKPGIYFNVWGSSTSLSNSENQEIATVEIDTIVGITNNITDNSNYNISIARYNYPKAPSSQYNELIARFSYIISAVTLNAEIDYSNNVFNSSKDGTYYNARIDLDIPSRFIFKMEDLTASVSYGHYNLPRSAGLNSFNDYMIGLKKKINNYTLALAWTTTDGKFDYGTYDDAHILGTLAVDF